MNLLSYFDKRFLLFYIQEQKEHVFPFFKKSNIFFLSLSSFFKIGTHFKL